MIQIIVLSAALIITLLILNSFLNRICGFDSAGDYGKVLEGTLTIGILYLVVMSLFGNSLMPDGIPFVDRMDSYTSLTEMFKNNLPVFVIECAELISLTFIISLISNLIPDTFGGNGITGKILRSIALVLIGLIANNYFLSLMEKTIFFSWAITALQCFLSGTALLMTPAMLIGNLLNLNPDSEIVSFLIKKLPQTKIGTALSTAASNSLLFIFVIMLFESQYGGINAFMNQIPAIISLFAPIVIIIIGIGLAIKSVTK